MNEVLLHNARALTMDPAHPSGEAVALRNGRIVAVGISSETPFVLDPDAGRVDCDGGVLLPAFIDAHCHLLSYAASLRSVDCTRARSIADIQDSLRRRANETRAAQWIRAFGYEETALDEGRHPDRHDLDAAAPSHPVRLIHGSSHASVLNSLALKEAGIDIATEEPPGGSMERELPSGEPSGVLLGMERLLDGVVPPLPYDELASGVREAARRLLGAGVTCVQDASHTNGRSEWELFERLIRDGALPLDVVLMEGFDHLGELPERGEVTEGEGHATGSLRRGAVKLMLDELEDDLSPNEEELGRRVEAVHSAGRQVAIHAVGERAVGAAAGAIEAALQKRPRSGHRHRIEHCGVLPAGMAPRLARLGVMVVSQPAFVYRRGERYLRLVPRDQHPALYAHRTLSDAGVTLAAGSDAPVTAPVPLASAAAAIERRTDAGRALGPEQAVEAEEALRWWTAGAAVAGLLDEERGAIRPGLLADLVLLPSEVTSMSPAELRNVRPLRVWKRGVQVEVDSGEQV